MPGSYRGRLAPSPTGELHLGLLRTALLGWLRARSEGGAFVLRIEDLDRPRVVPGSVEAILRDLSWLGLDWDEGPDCGGPHAPYVQSERLEDYGTALARLSASGFLYPCSCSRKEVSLQSAPHGLSELGPVYPGTCRFGPTKPGAPFALRFRMPDMLPTFQDAIHGAVPALSPPPGDFVLRRADGLYGYQFAVVVDDIAMQITEVLRGDDLLSSTPWQLALYDALGASRPRFAHVPLMLGADGERLAKRKGSTTLSELRAGGTQPERLVGLLAYSAGLLERPQSVRARELVDHFAVDLIKRSPSVLAGDLTF